MEITRSLVFITIGVGASALASAQYLPWYGPPVPGFAPPFAAPYYAPAMPMTQPAYSQSLHSESGMEGGEYVINLYLQGISPDSVRISPDAGGLSVRYSQQSEQGNPYGGFATSSMWMTQHIGLPPGLDLRAMQRLHNPQGIQVRIPFAVRR